MKSNERLCILCKENYVEDEIHFVCVCKIYDLHRKIFMITLKRSMKCLSIYLMKINLSFCLNMNLGNWPNISLRHGIYAIRFCLNVSHTYEF